MDAINELSMHFLVGYGLPNIYLIIMGRCNFLLTSILSWCFSFILVAAGGGRGIQKYGD